MIRYSSFSSPIGQIFVAKTDKGICRIGLPGEGKASLLGWLRNYFPEEPQIRDDDALLIMENELSRYFAGELEAFTEHAELAVSDFRRRVLEMIAEIPYGQTASYKELAERLGNPGAVRAVGGACAFNPVPIIIPCHRVIAHDGSLRGYGGGLDLKMRLLQIETLTSYPHPCRRS